MPCVAAAIRRKMITIIIMLVAMIMLMMVIASVCIFAYYAVNKFRNLVIGTRRWSAVLIIVGLYI